MTVNHIMSQSSALNASAKTGAVEQARVAEAAKATETSEEKISPSNDQKRFDRFEKSEEKPKTAAGIYHMGEDENGNPKIIVDEPTQPKAYAEEQLQPEKSSDEPAQPEDAKDPESKSKKTRCTVNTDKVDAEIERLKEKRQRIQQRLQSEENVDKRNDLENQLNRVDSELQAKNNDTYRKQHSTYTNG